jgi:hypothetical protein
MEYAYDFSGYCRSIGRGRADNVADKHVYSDGGGIKSILNIVVFLVLASLGIYLECVFPP